MKVVTGYTYNSKCNVPIEIDWKCTQCGEHNVREILLSFNGFTYRSVFSSKGGVESDLKESALRDLKFKIDDIHAGKYTNLSTSECICKKCEFMEPWAVPLDKPTSNVRILFGVLFWVNLILAVFYIKILKIPVLIIPTILLSVIFPIIRRLVYSVKLAKLKRQTAQIKKENLPSVRIKLESMITGNGNGSIMGRSDTSDEEKLKNGGWKCKKCGNINGYNMGFCRCGSSRSESKTDDKN